MFNKKLYDVVGKLVLDFNVEVSLSKDLENKLYLDLHTQAKSHMYLYCEEDKLVVKKRYNEMDTCLQDESVDDILSWLAYNYSTCIHGRGFGSAAWDKVCAHYGVNVSYGYL